MAALARRSRAALIALGALVFGCGLTTASPPTKSKSPADPATPAEGGAGGDAGRTGLAAGASSVAGEAGRGGSSSVEVGGRRNDSSGAAGEAGEGSSTQPVRPPFASGTRYCIEARECQQYECVGMVGAPKTVCLASCEESDCVDMELCVGTAFLAGQHCFATCELVTDCAYAFDCYRLEADGPRLCFPTEWALELGTD